MKKYEIDQQINDRVKVMYKKVQGLLIFLASLFLLVSCDLLEIIEEEMMIDNDVNEESSIMSISELENTTYFRDGALEHILEGELNGRGQAVGFHYDGLPTKKGEVIAGTETEPNEYGVYEAKVEVSGVEKASNSGKSSFFPDEWSAQQVVDAINEAYEDRNFMTGNTYEGFTSEGVLISMYLDQNDKIISAFPIY